MFGWLKRVSESKSVESEKMSERDFLVVLGGMFTNHNRRTLGAIAKLTGWKENEIFLAVAENQGYRVVRGGTSGKLYVSRVNV